MGTYTSYVLAFLRVYASLKLWGKLTLLCFENLIQATFVASQCNMVRLFLSYLQIS